MTFDEAFEKLIGHEGGYVNNPRDPGGETKYGISKRSYPNENIANLTLERAKEIYKKDFWKEDVPEEMKYSFFDAAVNSGSVRAKEWLRNSKSVAEFNGHRLEFMASLSTWPAFGRGWARRIASILKGD